MTLRHKLKCTLLLTTVLFTACLACRKQPTDEGANPPFSSEPEKYSATVVRMIEDGQQREVMTTRVVCSGDLRREEWTEAGATRALIFRPDLGKSFLLDLDNRLYVETDLVQPKTPAESTKKAPPKNSNLAPASSESELPPASGLQTVTEDFLTGSFEEEPTSVEVHTLPDETVAERVCKVSEQKATFADSRIEVTRTFRADSLKGLMVKTELESITPAQRTKITTERRDIKLDISADAFAIPAGFKKVERLLYR